jgi:hypothetical protein
VKDKKSKWINTDPDWMDAADREILGDNKHALQTKKTVRRNAVSKPGRCRAGVLSATRKGIQGKVGPDKKRKKKQLSQPLRPSVAKGKSIIPAGKPLVCKVSKRRKQNKGKYSGPHIGSQRKPPVILGQK